MKKIKTTLSLFLTILIAVFLLNFSCQAAEDVIIAGSGQVISLKDYAREGSWDYYWLNQSGYNEVVAKQTALRNFELSVSAASSFEYRELLVKNQLSVIKLCTLIIVPKKMIVVDLDKQKFYCLENGQVIRSGLVSSGRRGCDTQPGFYRIQTKLTFAWFRDPATGAREKMGNWMSFSADRRNGTHNLPGTAYEKRLGHPASHGCIRVSHTDSKLNWEWGEVGMPFIILNKLPNEDCIGWLKSLDFKKIKWKS